MKAKSLLLALLALALSATAAQARTNYLPVVTPGIETLPYKMVDGVKEFHLVAETFEQEVASGMVMKLWGYNGSSPGPTIEAVEGDRVRILVTNKLPEHHAVHWHGLLLPNGMDGVGGVTQPQIKPGETFAYEFTLRQYGTQMYHAHADEVQQMALGMMGFFIIHPKVPEKPKVDRDFAIFLHEWKVESGAKSPDPAAMVDFNLFTFNGRAYPGTHPLVVKQGDRVRLRIANVSMDSHPIHFHGHSFTMTATDGGQVPPSARWPETTVNVPPGTTRDVQFVAEHLGDWALHCHKSHHTMNPMGHDIPNLTGVSQEGIEDEIRAIVPEYMAMGENGMAEMADMQMEIPENTLPMMTGEGQFGHAEMGGMFTVVKIRKTLSKDEEGWYQHPAGTVSAPVKEKN